MYQKPYIYTIEPVLRGGFDVFDGNHLLGKWVKAWLFDGGVKVV